MEKRSGVNPPTEGVLKVRAFYKAWKKSIQSNQPGECQFSKTNIIRVTHKGPFSYPEVEIIKTEEKQD